jgi:acetyltransferase
VREALEAGGIANFYTPENAVDAFSFLAAYRRNQEWLLEVPPPQPEPQPPNLHVAERIRDIAVAAGRRVLSALEAHELLTMFGLPTAPAVGAETLNEALDAGRRLGYPVTLMLDATALNGTPTPPVERANLRDGRMVTRAWASLHGDEGRTHRHAGVIVRKDRAAAACRDVVIGVHTDAVFGPVIAFGIGGAAEMGTSEHVVLLPPLNERLAGPYIRDAFAAMAQRYDPTQALEAWHGSWFRCPHSSARCHG